MYLVMTLETPKNSEKQVLFNFVFIPDTYLFVRNAPFIYPLKTSENLMVFGEQHEALSRCSYNINIIQLPYNFQKQPVKQAFKKEY